MHFSLDRSRFLALSGPSDRSRSMEQSGWVDRFDSFEYRSFDLSPSVDRSRSFDLICSLWRILLRESSLDRPRSLTFKLEGSLPLTRERDNSLIFRRSFGRSRSLERVSFFRRLTERSSNRMDLFESERLLDQECFLSSLFLCSSLLTDRERFLDREPFIRPLERSLDLRRSLLRKQS